MFRTNQMICLLSLVFQQLVGWLLGDVVMARLQQFLQQKSLQTVPVEGGSRSRGFGSQSVPGRTNVEGMTMWLDPDPFDRAALDSMFWHGGLTPASRPAPPGWV
jgi:hypothetical protein